MRCGKRLQSRQFNDRLGFAFKQDGKWYLLGGEVEHEDRADHLSYLTQYVAKQTGLHLTALSEAIAISMNKTEFGGEATIFYLGQAEGKLTHGQIFDPRDLPELAPVCRNAAASIEQFFGSDNAAGSSPP